MKNEKEKEISTIGLILQYIIWIIILWWIAYVFIWIPIQNYMKHSEVTQKCKELGYDIYISQWYNQWKCQVLNNDGSINKEEIVSF